MILQVTINFKIDIFSFVQLILQIFSYQYAAK